MWRLAQWKPWEIRVRVYHGTNPSHMQASTSGDMMSSIMLSIRLFRRHEETKRQHKRKEEMNIWIDNALPKSRDLGSLVLSTARVLRLLTSNRQHHTIRPYHVETICLSQSNSSTLFIFALWVYGIHCLDLRQLFPNGSNGKVTWYVCRQLSTMTLIRGMWGTKLPQAYCAKLYFYFHDEYYYWLRRQGLINLLDNCQSLIATFFC